MYESTYTIPPSFSKAPKPLSLAQQAADRYAFMKSQIATAKGLLDEAESVADAQERLRLADKAYAPKEADRSIGLAIECLRNAIDFGEKRHIERSQPRTEEETQAALNRSVKNLKAGK